MMVMHKIKLEAVIGLIYLLPFTRRSPSVTLKLSPNAKFTGLFPVGIGAKRLRAVTFRGLVIDIEHRKKSYYIFRWVKRANKQTNKQTNEKIVFIFCLA